MSIAIIVASDGEAAAQLIEEVEITAWIEGGAGPVKLGVPVVRPNGERVIAHPFTAADLDWFRIYAEDIEFAILEDT